jgi:hypothetical protein
MDVKSRERRRARVISAAVIRYHSILVVGLSWSPNLARKFVKEMLQSAVDKLHLIARPSPKKAKDTAEGNRTPA